MIQRPAGSPGKRARRLWPTPSIVIASAALFLALGGSALAATSLIQAGDIAPGAVTSKAIRSGAVEPRALGASIRTLLESGGQGATGAKGDTGLNGTAGSNGANGPNGANGANGAEGAKGTNGINGANGLNGAEGAKGTNGSNGANGANGPNGANGVDGTNGTDGANGTDGINGTNGTNGTIAPLSATRGLTALPTASPPTTVVELAVPAGNYVVLAKTQLSHTGAGDSVECTLKAGATTIDQIAMKTLPALAAIPASMQAVTTTTTTPTVLSVQCAVLVANGSANFNSLIAIPTA
jgi:Collagen triple helix repeat (20 copies)